MDFENLKNQWQNQEFREQLDLQNLVKQAKHPLQQLRKSIKFEFIFQLVGLLFAAFCPQLISMPENTWVYYYASYAVFFSISIYYFWGFYQFYTQIDQNEQNLKEHLWHIYYELKIQIERYKAFGFLLIPHVWVIITLALMGKNWAFDEPARQGTYITTLFISTLLTVFLISYYAKKYYGRFSHQIQQILKQF